MRSAKSVATKPAFRDGPRADVRNQSVSRKESVRRKRSRYGRWRAATLGGVYVLMAIHIVHWKIAGRTVAPMEVNEMMVTLEHGVITAGAILFALILVGSALFGRFFCSWGCHILALQDLCSWLLGKIGIRPEPVRSRLLAWVPVGAAVYMFVWPQVRRVLAGRALPELSVRLTATDDFWRNLPGPGITALTFAVCGFALVYVLGSRGFCRYVCPYGAIFGLVDRATPGRIRVSDRCVQCGKCTSVCKSAVRVHEEVHAYGMVVNPDCLKDLDCVSVCPQQALSYKWGNPGLFRRWGHSRAVGREYDFTWPEDIFMLAVFVGAFFAYRGLYDAVPFLLALAIAAVVAYLSVILVRVLRQPKVRIGAGRLGKQGQTRVARWVVGAAASILLALTVHSGLIRYHHVRGVAWFDRVPLDRASMYQPIGAGAPALDGEAEEAVARSLAHLKACDRWGLVDTVSTHGRLGWLYWAQADPIRAEHHFRRAGAMAPDRAEAHACLGMVLAGQERLDEALVEYEASAQLGPDQAQGQLAVAMLLTRVGRAGEAVGQCQAILNGHPGLAEASYVMGSALMSAGRITAARDAFSAAVQSRGDFAEAHYNLGICLSQEGRVSEAAEHYRAAVRIRPEDAEARNNLGFVLHQMGRPDEAQRCFERALELDPDFAEPHVNMARLLMETGRYRQADSHLRRAVQIKPSLGELLGGLAGDPNGPRKP